MEDPIKYARYLIGVIGEEAGTLCRRLLDPLPLSELIFVVPDDDIRVWLLANLGQDPLDLLVLEGCQDQGEG